MPKYARYRAPAESGQKLVSPSWSELGPLVRANQKWRRNAEVAILGQPIAEFAAAARREILDVARAYVSTYDCRLSNRMHAELSNALTLDAPLIVTGHQPEMFHPGVWLKNFAAGELARQLGGVALNLVIDSDACHATSIRIPVGSREQPRFGVVEFDKFAPNVPWEERGIVDPATWQTFQHRARAMTTPMLSERMLDGWWSSVVDRSVDTGRIGLSIAQARHLDELALGQRSLELPQSRICATNAFRRFAYYILTNIQRFVAAYNDALAVYRRAHSIRNHAQPVPNLAHSGEWLEAPFWLWSTTAPVRRPAFVRVSGGQLTISDRKSFERTLPIVKHTDVQVPVDELDRWEAEGCKLRSRALITTMFARLALSDLFIHGIGGAKYDEATDGVCEKFYGKAPPAYATVSGTLHLPIAQAADSQDCLRRLRHKLRDLEFHPERFLVAAHSSDNGSALGDNLVEKLVTQKQQWISTPKTKGNASERHRGIVAANSELRALLAHQFDETGAILAKAGERIRTTRVLNSREYAFCLFPPNALRLFLLDFSSKAL